MTKIVPVTIALLAAGAALAEDSRELDAHEHGVGQLNIAFDGDQIAMELHAPGADIVGFEYEAKTAEDRDALDAAVATLARPLDLFALPEAAGCNVVEASASLEAEADKDEGADHDDKDHDDEEHADHDHEEHADHDHEEHADLDHEDKDHDDHAEEARHTEFNAEYLLNCADPSAASVITFAYFDVFPNALELEVQVISEQGATAFEVERDEPVLDLRDMF